MVADREAGIATDIRRQAAALGVFGVPEEEDEEGNHDAENVGVHR